jgi:hypothetical protein
MTDRVAAAAAEFTEQAAEIAELNRQRVPVAGGVMVYQSIPGGRELVGCEDVTDWSKLESAVVARGYDRGDVLHLPELDE